MRPTLPAIVNIQAEIGSSQAGHTPTGIPLASRDSVNSQNQYPNSLSLPLSQQKKIPRTAIHPRRAYFPKKSSPPPCAKNSASSATRTLMNAREPQHSTLTHPRIYRYVQTSIDQILPLPLCLFLSLCTSACGSLYPGPPFFGAAGALMSIRSRQRLTSAGARSLSLSLFRR